MKKPVQNQPEDKGYQISIVERTDAQPPIDFTGLRINLPKENSVGIPAIFSSLVHMGKYMKPGAAVKTMFKVNQKGGFDCPGCAWPDPDDEPFCIGRVLRKRH